VELPASASKDEEEPPQMMVRSSAPVNKSKGGAKTKATKAIKEKANKEKAKVKRKDDDEDSEIKFKPAQFYPKTAAAVKPETVNKSDAATAASALAAPAPKGRPKLSVKNSDKDQAKKVKKVALSVAKENRDKIKAVKKVKKVVKELAAAADGTTAGVKKVKKVKKALGINHGGVNVNPMKLSSTLQSIVGKQPLTRNQAVKKLWAYIKSKNLQDPDDKAKVRCDAKLKALTKKSEIDSCGIFAALSGHMERM